MCGCIGQTVVVEIRVIPGFQGIQSIIPTHNYREYIRGWQEFQGPVETK